MLYEVTLMIEIKYVVSKLKSSRVMSDLQYRVRLSSGTGYPVIRVIPHSLFEPTRYRTVLEIVSGAVF